MPSVECVDAAGARVGEGALWDGQDGILYWVDIDAGLLHRFDPSSGPEPPVAVGEKVGCLTLRAGGGVLLATESGIHAYDFASGEKSLVADPEADRPHNRFNDGATDPRGRWWIGSMGMMRPQRAEGAFWRIDPGFHVTRWVDGLYTTNGLAFAPDGRTMYLSDSHPDVRTIWACDYDLDTGMPTDRRIFFDTRQVDGLPDGATVDADGCYWMAGVDGWQLVRLTPRGEVDMIVPLPVERPSRPMFGGADLSTLFVTSISSGLTPGSEQPLAGGLFAITGLPVGGLPVPRFAG